MNSALPKNTIEVRERISDFKEKELRKVFYDIAKEYREEYRDDRENFEPLIKSIKIILLGWNWRAYAGEDISNEELHSQIRDFIVSNKSLLELLESSEKTLESTDFQKRLGNKRLRKHIEDFFNSLKKEDAIGSTGASKFLHMFYPEVFMMWDGSIISEYHKEKEKNHWKKHSSGSGECYAEFLDETQEFIREKLDLEKLGRNNPAKVMDEYNYAKHTLDNE